MDSNNKRYNGWTNYETWNVALWLRNDAGSDQYWSERTEEIARAAEPEYDWEDKRGAAVRDLAQEIQSEIEESDPLADQASLFSDLLRAALSEVNWREIAENWLSDLPSEVWEEESAEHETDAE
jgi:hypothetical protein